MATSKIKSSLDLLWTNSNPTGSMGRKTLISGVDLSEYSTIRIDCVNDGGTVFIPVLSGTQSAVFAIGFNWQTDGDRIRYRGFYLNSSNNVLDCAECYERGIGSSSAVVSANGACVPEKIYGIK